jgi:outer membrane immunogenic protein
MRKQLLCSVAALAITAAIGGTSLAADLPLKARQAPELMRPLTWTGFYVGGHLGWGRGKYDGVVREGESDEFGISDSPDGAVGGLHGGYNWQSNTFVYGWEADISASGIGSTVFSAGPDACSATRCHNGSVNLLASLRARLGLTFDRTLIYATGGLGFAHAKVLTSFATTGFGAGKFNAWGWVAGLGAEWKQTPNFSWRVEGLWYGFDKTVRIPNHDGSLTARIDLKDVLVIRLGATYHFDR